MVAIELLGLVLLTAILGHAEIHLDIAGDSQERLMAVLLEELPLQHLGTQPRVRWQKLAAVGQIVEDGVGLPQAGAILQLKNRNLAIRVLLEKLLGAGLTTKDIDRNPFVRLVQQVRSEEHTSELQSLMRISYAVF